VLEASPQRTDVLPALARAMALDGEYAAAADLFRRALGLRPTTPWHGIISAHACWKWVNARRERRACGRGAERAANGRARDHIACRSFARPFLFAAERGREIPSREKT